MGEQEQRLNRTVAGANVADISTSGFQWREGGNKLERVEKVLLEALEDVRNGFGENSEVSTAAVTAFERVAAKARDRSKQMRDASDALDRANASLSAAVAEQRALAASAPSEPQAPQRTPGVPDSPDTMRAEQRYSRELGSYQSAMADRETRAKQRSDEVDATYTESAEVMRRIHGEPDERVMRDAAGGGRGGSGSGSGAGGGGGGSTPSGGGRYTPTSSHGDTPQVQQTDDQSGNDESETDPTPDRHPDDPTSDQTPPADSDAPGNAPSVLGQPVTPGSSGTGGSGGLTAGLGGGLAGSAVMGGAVVLGGRLAGGMGATSAAGASTGSTAGRPSSARPIGSGRTSGGATLGRGAATSGSPTGARGGASGATGTRGGSPTTGARGAGGAGGARGAAAGQAGSRGAGSAGRGAAGGATGRGKKGDPQAPDQEFFATEDDWTDDEGHAGRSRLRLAPAQPASTSETGRLESAGRSSDDGVRPRATISEPRAATMAPLSVHSPGRGTRTRMPSCSARSSASWRSRELAATPAADEQVVDALAGGGVEGLAHQHVADRLLERCRHVGDRHRLTGPLARLDPAGHGGLEAREGEVEAVPLEVAARGQPAREVDVDAARPRGRSGRCAGHPGTAGRAAGRPCRRPPPPRRRWSRPSGRRPTVTSSTRSRLEWPPLTSIARHGSGSGPCSSWSTATCEARWLTP